MRSRGFGNPVSLESCVDIMTNVIGVFVLIAALTAVSATDAAKVNMGRPMLHKPPEGLKRVLFECRHGKVFAFPEDELGRKLDEGIANRGGSKFSSASDIESFLRSLELDTDDYKVQPLVMFPFTVALKFELREGAKGDTVSELTRRQSRFSKTLAGLTPKQRWLFFVVREDSFEAFITARRVAKETGFEVGWHPMKSSENIIVTLAGGGGGGGLGTMAQ